MTATSFGAVIVNYNCAPLALDAALSFVGAGGARAVIVDNASTDESADYFSAALSDWSSDVSLRPRRINSHQEPLSRRCSMIELQF